MANGPEINKFETTDLASFYKKNGSQFSTIQPVVGRSNSPAPEILSSNNKTPLTDLAKNSTIEVFPLPASPSKIGIEPKGFLFSPAFTAPEVSAFGFLPGFTTPSLKVSNGIPNIDAVGFSKNMSYPNSDFKGIKGKPGSFKFNSEKLSTQLKVHNGISDIDMNGFVTGKKHLGSSDFKGIKGNMPNLTFKMSTINPGNSSTWTRQQYNDKITTGLNNIPNIAQNGFVTGKKHLGPSDFIGIAEEKYTYPALDGYSNSYRFGTQNYDTVFTKVTPSSVPGKTDSVGQQFKITGYTSPYGDFNIQARKSQYSDTADDQFSPFKGANASQITKQYLEIPGVGETDLRKESRNDFSFGNATDQPFITRDIGSNWSLFSNGPGPKFGIDLIRGGVGTAINRSLIDALRIGKFLISPKGLLFIAKNVGMQLTNPKMQIDNILGIGANRIYALGLPTVAQSLTNAVGIHLVRHGLGPLNGTLPKNARYEDNIFNMESRAASAGGGSAAKKALSEAGFESPDTGQLTDKSDVDLSPSSGTPSPLGKGNPRTKSRLAFLQTDLKSGLLAVSDAGGKGAGQADLLTGALASGIDSLTGGMTKAKITRLSDKSFFGPNSVYGIGGTTIFRSRVGIGVSAHEETGGTYADSKFLSGLQNAISPLDKTAISNPSVARQYDTPDDGNKYSDKNGTNIFDDMTSGDGGNQSQLATRLDAIIATDGEDAAPDNSSYLTSDGHSPFPTVGEDNLYYSQNQRLRRYETLAYGQIPKNADRNGNKLMDFRELLPNNNKNFQQPNEGDIDAAPWGGKDMVTRFGADYGKLTTADGGATADRSNRLFDLGYDDTVVNNEGRTFQQINAESAEYADQFEDFINFRFSSKRPGQEEEFLQFRAFLSGITDAYNIGFQDIGYVGRTTPTYLFQQIERDASFSFKLYSMSRSEMEANYKRLNRFIQIISPEIKSGLPVGPLIKLTIGDWWVDNPFIVENFSMTPVENGPWDIDEGRQLPFYVDCSVSGKVLFSKANVGGETTDRVHSSATDTFAAITNNSWRLGNG